MRVFLKSTVGRILVLETGRLAKLRAVAEGWREGRRIARETGAS